MNTISVIEKLFRDNLVPQQTAMGRTILCTKYTGKQLIDALYDKLEEELSELKQLLQEEREYIAAELQDLRKKVLNEAKDAQEVIDSLSFHGEWEVTLASPQQIIDEICDKFEITKEILAEAQRVDREDRWSFREWWYVKKLQIPEGDKWYEYFKNKYPQVDSFDDDVL